MDCSDLAEQEQQRYLQDTFTEYANTPLDLATGPLIKAGLLRFGAQEHALILVIHHIVFDGWSTSVFIREFASLYGELLEGKESGLPEVGIQYVDYAAWHEKALSGEAFEQSATFWRRYLSDAPPLSTLPGDFARPGQVSHAGSALSMTLSPDLSQALNKLATQRGTTLFTLLLASFQLLMHRQTRQHDLIVGTDVAGRSHPDVEPLIGFFVNVIPLRSRLADDQVDFGRWLEHVQTSVLDAFDHQDVPSTESSSSRASAVSGSFSIHKPSSYYKPQPSGFRAWKWRIPSPARVEVRYGGIRQRERYRTISRVGLRHRFVPTRNH